MNAQSQAREDLVRIFRAALDAAAPDRLTAAALRGELEGAPEVPALLSCAGRIFVLAVGKAAGRMMAAAQHHLGPRIAQALAVVPAQAHCARAIHAARVYPGGHPLPDANSAAAAQAALAMLETLTAADL